MKYIVLLVSFVGIGCTDATLGSIGSLGESSDVECFSGGQSIFKDRSTGKVEMLEGGGWHYRSVDGAYVRTFADCFVRVK